MSMEIITQKNSQSQATANARWAVFCSAFSFTVTGIVTVMHLSPMLSDFIIGTKLEGIITIVLAAFWAATVSVGTYNVVVYRVIHYYYFYYFGGGVSVYHRTSFIYYSNYDYDYDYDQLKQKLQLQMRKLA
ncbi:MAG: hypothetical protein ACI8RD_014906 [Bacillariaceae sp.]|jgi:hypothetical protein